MTDQTALKNTLEGLVKQLAANSALGRTSRTSTVRVRNGTTCDVEVEGHKLVVDTPKSWGGENLGPVPGALVRAGLGSCLAIGYVFWAARLGVPLEEVEVTVAGDFDARGTFGVDDSVPRGIQAFRYTTTIRSSAPRQQVQELVDTADRHSAVLDTLSRAIPVKRELNIT